MEFSPASKVHRDEVRLKADRLQNGRGYVYVPDSQQRGLLPGEETEHGPIYSVAMFHQLHCLARLRKSHWILLDGVATGDTGVARGFAGREAAQHIQHCFDYLRQSVMCAGDMTLEWPKQEGTAAKAKVDGWGIPHTCKSKVRRLMKLRWDLTNSTV